jgi:hypothetical protein
METVMLAASFAFMEVAAHSLLAADDTSEILLEIRHFRPPQLRR